jgi:hypothetical protein
MTAGQPKRAPLIEPSAATRLVGLPTCEYTFGHTRVSADPIYHRNYNGRDYAAPVRLNAFSTLPDGKHPIYALEQNNEARYVRLDATRLAACGSRQTGCATSPQPKISLQPIWSATPTLGRS